MRAIEVDHSLRFQPHQPAKHNYQLLKAPKSASAAYSVTGVCLTDARLDKKVHGSHHMSFYIFLWQHTSRMASGYFVERMTLVNGHRVHLRRISIKLPKSKQELPYKWVYKMKIMPSDGKPKYKAQSLAKGFK